QRGLGQPAAHLDSNCPFLLAELGRPEEALERADRLTSTLAEAGLTHSLCEVRAVELVIRLARGEREVADRVEWLLETGRATGAVDVIVYALACAAAVVAAKEPERALSLLSELEQSA